MSCPVCGREAPPDPETGYDAADVCPDCAQQGWTYANDGTLINDYKPEPVSEYDQVRR